MINTITDEDRVLWQRQDAVATITLNRPDKLNAWTAAMRSRLVELLERADQDPQVSAIVLTGAGRGFCAGQDLAETAAFDAEDETAAAEWIDSFQRLYDALRRVEKPTVAAVNGVCAGSGFQFALLADLRVGHVDVRLGQPELLSGIPSITGIWAMWSVLGRAKTTEFILTGQLVGGVEAHRLGLLTELTETDQVLARSQALARAAGALPPQALRLTKRRLRELEDVSFADAFDAARQTHAAAYATGEPQEQMRRFLAERGHRD